MKNLLLSFTLLVLSNTSLAGETTKDPTLEPISGKPYSFFMEDLKVDLCDSDISFEAESLLGSSNYKEEVDETLLTRWHAVCQKNFETLEEIKEYSCMAFELSSTLYDISNTEFNRDVNYDKYKSSIESNTYNEAQGDAGYSGHIYDLSDEMSILSSTASSLLEKELSFTDCFPEILEPIIK